MKRIHKITLFIILLSSSFIFSQEKNHKNKINSIREVKSTTNTIKKKKLEENSIKINYDLKVKDTLTLVKNVNTIIEVDTNSASTSRTTIDFF